MNATVNIAVSLLLVIPLLAHGEVISYPLTEGVTVDLSLDGSECLRIRSTGEAALTSDDPVDVQHATDHAIYKAEATIARFLSEEAETENTISGITKALSEHNGQTEAANRKFAETLAKKLKTSGHAYLEEVDILEKRIDRLNKKVAVSIASCKTEHRPADQRNHVFHDYSMEPTVAGPKYAAPSGKD